MFSEILAAVATLVAAAIAVLWPELQRRHRVHRLYGLIRRELKEIAPLPLVSNGKELRWFERGDHRFIHRDIVTRPSQNSSLLLSLHPNIAYALTQLWFARDTENAVSFKHFLNVLAKGEDEIRRVSSEELKEVAKEWYPLLTEHKS